MIEALVALRNFQSIIVAVGCAPGGDKPLAQWVILTATAGLFRNGWRAEF